MKATTTGFIFGLAIFMIFKTTVVVAESSAPPAKPSEEQSDAESSEKDQTFLLDESLISAEQLDANLSSGRGHVAGPALSTTLRWEGEALSELDIPKEILDHLTQSDGFLLNAFRDDEDDFDDDFADDSEDDF